MADTTRGQNTESTETTDVRYRPVVQNRIVQISQQARDEEGGGISDEAVKAFAEEYGMSEDAARKTIEEYQRGVDTGQYEPLGATEKASLEAATEGGSLYEIAPETTREKYGEPEIQEAKVSEREQAIQRLSAVGGAVSSPISGQIEITPEAFKKATSDEAVLQSLYDLGLDTKDVNEAVQFHKEHLQLPDGKYVRLREWEELPEKYQSIAMREGLKVAGEVLANDVATFEQNHIQLRDGQWVEISQWNELPDKYKSIGIQQGYRAMADAIEKAQATLSQLRQLGYGSMRGEYPEGGAPYETYQKAPMDLVKALDAGYDKDKLIDVFGSDVVGNAEQRLEAIRTLNQYKTDTGYNLPKAIQDGVAPETVILAGFKPEDVNKAVETVGVAERTSVAIPGDVTWQRRTGEIVTDAEYRKIITETPSEQDYYRLSVPSGRRKLISGTATLLFSPTRVALPEVVKADIDALEWAVGGAQLAGWAMPVLPTKALPVVSAIGSGIFGVNLARNWNDLSTPQKTLGVAGTLLYASPSLISAVRKAIPVAVKIPTNAGEVTIWRGYTAMGKPAIGISGGRLTVGTKGITRIPADVIPEGYRPITKVETSIMATKKAMTDAGMSQEGIDRVSATLDIGNHLTGKKSPYTPKTARPEAIKSLSAKSVAEILDEAVNPRNKVQQIYGSTTIKAQLKPELRWWRMPGDIDIQTNLTADEVMEFAERLLLKLKKVEPRVKFEIPSTERGLIRVFKDGKWNNAVDIHGVEPVSANAIERADTLASISKTTGDYTYGLRVSEPSVTINYPGIGKVKIMSLAESGKRKLDAILKWRGEKTVAPEPHRVKDIVDMYVIAQTFKGGAITDELLAEFARVWGLTPEELARLSQQYPTRMGVFEFTPASGVAKEAIGSPIVSINVPSYLIKSSPQLASLLASPSLLSSIGSASVYSSSVPISSLSPSIGITSASISPSIGISPSGLISPSISPVSYPSVSGMPIISASVPSMLSSVSVPSPSTSPSVSPSPSPSLSPSPSPGLSPSPSYSPAPSPSPSLVSSPSPSPTVTPTPSPTPPPTGIVRLQTRSPQSQPIPEGSIAFALGKRKGVRGILVPQWYYIPPPWTQRKPISMSAPPYGAINIESASPYDTIQVIGRSRKYDVPEAISIDIGISDAFITNYGTEIVFGGKGVETDVGTSLRSTTVGMSIDSGELIPGIPVTDTINRANLSKKKPKRKRSSQSVDINSMQGVRL